MPDLRGLRILQEDVAAAEKELREYSLNLFPVGARVAWKKGFRVQHGRVIMQGYGDRMRVVNENTGSEQWITLYHILEDA